MQIDRWDARSPQDRAAPGKPSLPSRLRAAAPLCALLALLLSPHASGAAPALQWSDLYDGGASYLDLATAVLAAPGGDLIVGGESADGIDGIDMLVRRLARETGETLWTRRFTSFDTNDMALSDLAFDSQGRIIVGGFIRGCPT